MFSPLRPLALSALVPLALAACSSTPDSNERFPAAQSIVDGIAAKHGVARLTLHAVPRGEERAMFVASTDLARVGRVSDPEDVMAIDSGATTILREGENFDVTVPLRDAAGQVIAAAGVTMAMPAGTTDDEARVAGEAIAAELQAAVQTATAPLW